MRLQRFAPRRCGGHRLTGRRVGGRLATAVARPPPPRPPRRAPRPPRPRRAIAPGTRFFVPPPSAGAPQQVVALLKSARPQGRRADRGDGDDTAGRLVHQRHARPGAGSRCGRRWPKPRFERAVPVLVAYDIPGRDCAQYSAGGALNEADYEAWINGFAAGHRQRQGGRHPGARRARQHAVGLRAARRRSTRSPTPSGSPSCSTRSPRWRQTPGSSVYLDGTHSAWQSVGTITQRLLEADVQQAQGFFLNVSNYQPTPTSSTTAPGSQTASRW